MPDNPNTPQRPRVSILFPDQRPAAAAMLGRAFVDDPMIRAVLPPIADRDERARCMGAFFAAILADGDDQPLVGVLDEGKVVAAAIIEYVERAPSAASVVLHGLPLIPAYIRAIGLSGLQRAISVLDILTRNRPPERHLYLNVLGVEPALQRRHLGGALLDYLRDQAAMRPDFTGVYLETATEANVAYYTRFGYRVLGEISPLGVKMWRMLQPRPAS